MQKVLIVEDEKAISGVLHSILSDELTNYEVLVAEDGLEAYKLIEKDDFAFTFNKEKNIGYLSSNRAGGDDIYSIAPVCKGQVLTVVQNAKTEALIPKSKVVILDENGAVLDTQYSNENGEVLYDLECQKAYAIEVYKDGFVTGKFPIAKLTGGKVLINAVVAPIEVIVTETEIVLKPIYFENDKSTITKWGAAELDKLVYIMSQNKNLIIYFITTFIVLNILLCSK